jgi:hypothetical protein
MRSGRASRIAERCISLDIFRLALGSRKSPGSITIAAHLEKAAWDPNQS